MTYICERRPTKETHWPVSVRGGIYIYIYKGQWVSFVGEVGLFCRNRDPLTRFRTRRYLPRVYAACQLVNQDLHLWKVIYLCGKRPTNPLSRSWTQCGVSLCDAHVCGCSALKSDVLVWKETYKLTESLVNAVRSIIMWRACMWLQRLKTHWLLRDWTQCGVSLCDAYVCGRSAVLAR